MKRDDLFAGYEQGERDMLAKCIAAVKKVDNDKCDGYGDRTDYSAYWVINRDETIAAIESLGEQQ